MIKVLSIGYDRKVFETGSVAEEKFVEYGKLFEELHLVVFSTKAHKLKSKKISDNVWAYPTDSLSRWLYVRDAITIGKNIIPDRKFVRGLSVIMVQGPFESGLVGLNIKKRWRLPLHVSLHTDPFSPYFSGFVNALRKRCMPRILKNADGVRVVTEDLKDKLVEKFDLSPTLIDVLPIYVDRKKVYDGKISFDSHARYGFDPVILTVARLAAEKKLNKALDVMAKLRTYFPKAGLVIVGDGPERPKLESQARASGVGANVVFAGWQEDLASYYGTADMYLQTSAYEGYGLSLVEAGLSGLAAVSTPVGIADELENGKDIIICPQDDPDFMFKAIYDLASNPGERESLGRHLKDTLQKKMLAKSAYLECFKEMLERASKKVSL